MPTVALPERGQLTFSYNAHNRPISVSKNNIILENYTHDHEGRRIQEGNTITIYDGYNAIAEYTVNGVLKTTYAWGLDLSNTLQGAGGVGGLLSVTDYPTQTPLVSYSTYDGNGNVTEYVTEANNGTIATHYEYDSFGNVIRNTMNRNYRYQFSTKPYNKLTGLSYYNYRDYDPITGRWTSPDPIEEQGGLNLYGFVGNNANDYIDYLGLKACSRRVKLTHFGDGKDDDVGTRDNKLKPGDIAVGHYGKNSDPDSSKQWVLPFGTKVKIYPDNSPPFNGTVSDVGAYDKVALGKNKEKIYTPSDWIDVWNPDKSKKQISDEGCIEVEVKDACPCPKTYEDKPCPSSTKSS